MTIYALSAINGDLNALNMVLDQIEFDRENDQLWFSGNVVNGGDDSLEVLRFIKNLGQQAVLVLGHQELRLLAFSEQIESHQPDEKFAPILAADDSPSLLKWLYQRPLLQHGVGYTLVHAGIPAEWSLSQARTYAIEAESSLAMGNHQTFFENMAGKTPTRWHPKLRGWMRLRFIINALTNMSYCDQDGRFDFSISDPKEQSAKGYFPWSKQSNRVMVGHTIICANTLNLVEQGIQGIIPLHCSDDDHPISVMRLTA